MDRRKIDLFCDMIHLDRPFADDLCHYLSDELRTFYSCIDDGIAWSSIQSSGQKSERLVQFSSVFFF